MLVTGQRGPAWLVEQAGAYAQHTGRTAAQAVDRRAASGAESTQLARRGFEVAQLIAPRNPADLLLPYRDIGSQGAALGFAALAAMADLNAGQFAMDLKPHLPA